MQKWNSLHYHTKKWIIIWTAVIIAVVGTVSYFSIKAIRNYDPYAKYTEVHKQLEGKYETTNYFLDVGESVYFDINEHIKDIGFIPKKIEFEGKKFRYDNKSKTITTMSGVAAIGEAELSVAIFDSKNKEIHRIVIAKGYVYDSENSIEIKTAQDLANISQNMTGRYILKDNIDLADFGEWTPIGDSTRNLFEGYLINPNGFKIKNLKITSSVNFAGLFGYTNNAYIDGIILENIFIDITSSTYYRAASGGIVGYAPFSTIHNCVVQGTVIGSETQGAMSGGIVGNLEITRVIGCIFAGKVKSGTISNRSAAGGIAGYGGSGDEVIDCFAAGEIDSGYCASGIVGYFYGNKIRNCLFVGELLNAQYKNELYGNPV